MSLRRLSAISRKEFHHVTRDARILFLVTIAPALLLFLLAYVFSLDADHFKLIVFDQDKTDLSRRYIADLTGDGSFQLIGYVENYGEIDARLRAGQANLALTLPRGTAAKLAAHQPAPVQVIVDGVDAIAGNQAIGQLDGRTKMFAFSLLPTAGAGRSGIPGTVDLRSLAWYNPPLKSLNGMVPGLISVVLSMPTLALSLSLTREKELGSFEGLAATPIRGLEYIAGKMITYVGLGLVSTLPVVLVATAWFHVPFRGNLIVLLILVACYLLASFGLSLVVASVTKSQQTAMMVVILVFFVPSFFLTGLIMPVNTGSLVSLITAYVLPTTHFVVISRGVFLKGLDIAGLLSPTSALLLIAGVTLVVGLARFRKWID